MSLFVRIFGVSKAKNKMGNSSSSASKADNGKPRKVNNKKNKKLNRKEITKIVQRLYDFEELLQKKISFVDSQIDKEIKNAKKHGMKNKRAALGALRRKKNLELRVARLENTLATIELQRESLESATTNAEIFKVMQQANSALTSAHSNLDIDAINRLMDDVADQQEISREMNEAISNPVGISQEFDEDDLMKELDDLIEEEKNKDDHKYKKRRQPALPARHPSQVSHMSNISDLPDIPNDDFSTWGRSATVQRRRDEEVIRQLESWVAS